MRTKRVAATRLAVRDRVAMGRRWARPDPAVTEANRKHFGREREAHADRLARMSRVILHAFPRARPAVLVVLDVGRRDIRTFVGADEVAAATREVSAYDIIAAVDVRGLLQTLDLDPGGRRLGELGPPQKTRQLNRRGRTLKITMSLLVQGSCGISRPFGEERVLRGYLERGELSKPPPSARGGCQVALRAL